MESKRISSLSARVAVFAGLSLFIGAFAHADFLPPPEENHVEFEAGVGLVDGDRAAFRERAGMRQDAFGGISSLRYRTDVDDGWLLTIDGRAIAGLDDYHAHAGLTNEDFATLRFGFETRRYWSSAHAVGFPPDVFLVPFQPELGLDRSKFYVEFQVHRPQAPVYTLRYTRTAREGQKASTMWGDTNLTGALRSVVPAFYDLDETRHIIELRADHEGDVTTWSAGVVYEKAEKDNRRVMRRQPGAAADRYLVHQEGTDNDMLTLNGSVRTFVSEQLTLMSSALWTTLNGRITGDRIYGASADPVFDPNFPGRQARDGGVLDLLGNSNLRQFVGTVGAVYSPAEHWTIIPSFRFERMYQDVSTGFTTTSVGTGAGLPVSFSEQEVESDKDFNSVAGRLDLRYTGIRRWTFSGSAMYEYGEGSLEEEQFRVSGPTPSLLLDRLTDYQQERIRIRGGAHWQARPGVRLTLGAYHRFNRSEYDHIRDSGGITGGSRFPAYLEKQDFRVNGLNSRVSWRLRPNLTSITRYDYQIAKTHSRAANGLEVQSGRRQRQILSQSLSWQPLPRLSTQAGFSLVNDSLRTPPNVTFDASGAEIVLPDRLHYYSFNLNAFYAINDTTDLMVVYNGYFTDNYKDNSATGLPLGDNTEENSLISTLTKRMTENVTLTMQYGLYTYRDGLSRHNRDFTAHVISSRVLYHF